MLTDVLKTRIEHGIDTRSVAFSVWLYRGTNGRITRLWHRRAIVLTTTGWRSGRPRTVLVQVFQDGSDLFVVAANSGLPRPPGWYVNLLAEPRAVAELDGHRLPFRAEQLSEAEAADRWHRVVLSVARRLREVRTTNGQHPRDLPAGLGVGKPAGATPVHGRQQAEHGGPADPCAPFRAVQPRCVHGHILPVQVVATSFFG